MKKISDALKVPESLIYIMAMEKGDVPEEKRTLYDELYPIITSLVMRILKTDKEEI